MLIIIIHPFSGAFQRTSCSVLRRDVLGPKDKKDGTTGTSSIGSKLCDLPLPAGPATLGRRKATTGNKRVMQFL